MVSETVEDSWKASDQTYMGGGVDESGHRNRKPGGQARREETERENKTTRGKTDCRELSSNGRRRQSTGDYCRRLVPGHSPHRWMHTYPTWWMCMPLLVGLAGADCVREEVSRIR